MLQVDGLAAPAARQGATSRIRVRTDGRQWLVGHAQHTQTRVGDPLGQRGAAVRGLGGPHVHQSFHQTERQIGGVGVDGCGGQAEAQIEQSEAFAVGPERRQPSLAQLRQQVQRPEIPPAGEKLRTVERGQGVQLLRRRQGGPGCVEACGEMQRRRDRLVQQCREDLVLVLK